MPKSRCTMIPRRPKPTPPISTTAAAVVSASPVSTVGSKRALRAPARRGWRRVSCRIVCGSTLGASCSPDQNRNSGHTIATAAAITTPVTPRTHISGTGLFGNAQTDRPWLDPDAQPLG